MKGEKCNMIYPKIYLNSITEITLEFLEKNNLKGLILDIDNTLMDFDRNISQDTIDWCYNLKANNIKMCILSNTNKVDKVKKAADRLKLEYIYFAKKPFKKGFSKAKNLLGLKPENIGVVGDQIFTDTIGANRSKMFAILVKPVDKRDILPTKLKRPIENFIIRMYLKKGVNNVYK